MYICAKCEKVSKPREKLNKVVIQTRKKDYFDPKTGKQIATGFETVREVGYCTTCLNVQNQ